MSDEIQPTILNLDDAARYLSVSSTWLRTHRSNGDVPSIRVGHHVRFRIEDLDDYINGLANGPKPRRRRRTAKVAV